MKEREKEIDHLVDCYLSYNSSTGIISHKIKRSHKVIIGQEAGTNISQGRRQIQIKGKLYLAHRIAWRLYYGKWPKNVIDHIDGNPYNNRICNLRDVTHKENMNNFKRHRQGRSAMTSYNKNRDKFHSRIIINKKQFHLGLFNNEVEAYNQYLRAVDATKVKSFSSAKELREHLKNTK